MRGLSIGRPFGIEVRLDASWFLIGLLIAWSLGSFFQQQVPGLASGAYVFMGVFSAVLFFSCVLAHELSHSLVARRKGISVEGITLFIFGGVAQIKQEPARPGDEFQIAIVGPLMSAALALLFFALTLGADAAHTRVAAEMFGELAAVNLILAGFNLLPGFPLDGGRVLRAIVWKITGDFVKATKVAATAGRVAAVGLMGLGVLRIVFSNQLFGGIWLILIGLFLNQAASASYKQVLVRHSVEGVTAADLMTSDPETIPGNLRLNEAVDEYFLTKHHTAFPVLGYGDLVEGLIILNSIREVPRDMWPERTVRQVMAPVGPALVAAPGEPVTSILERMADNPTGRFLVLDGQRLAGILSVSDIAGFFRLRESLGGS
jgi:Zn-dependent protease